MNEATVATCDPGLRLDLGIRGVWQPQMEALFDASVIDTDAPSHCHRAPNAILESSAQEKKRMYKKARRQKRHLHPICTLPHLCLHPICPFSASHLYHRRRKGGGAEGTIAPPPPPPPHTHTSVVEYE